ncbi:MAG: DUF5677 domain-containing protein [Candidatus Binatus sp.]
MGKGLAEGLAGTNAKEMDRRRSELRLKIGMEYLQEIGWKWSPATGDARLEGNSMSDFVGELLGSRELADLASRIYGLGDTLRAKLLSGRLTKAPSTAASIFFFGRCMKTYQAAVELLRLGFWQDAAVLARVLREAEYQISWIASGGDATAQLFLKDHSRNRRNVIRTLSKHGDPEIKAQAQEIIEGTASDETLDEWWRNWWSKERNQGIGWLAEKLGRNAHRFENATLSAFVHTSPALLDFYFHEAGDGFGVIVESRPGVSDENREFAETVVFSVFAAFVEVCTAFAQQMGFGFEDELTQITERIRLQFAPNPGNSGP